MKIVQQGFEPEFQPKAFGQQVNAEAAQIVRQAPRRSRVRLQPIMTDGRLFHAYSA